MTITTKQMKRWISTLALSSSFFHTCGAFVFMSNQSQRRQRIAGSKSIIIRMNSSNENNDLNSGAVRNHKRVLCLHGKGSDGQSFKDWIAPLEGTLNSVAFAHQLKFEFDYLDAPYIMNGNEHTREWWTLPPGVRSFNAKEYQGYVRSKMIVKEAVTNQNYDFILGHSQGAILLATLMSSEDWNLNIAKGYIFNGSAWPNPFAEQMNMFQNRGMKVDSSPQNCDKGHLLFIIGDSDSVNPPEGAIQVRDVMSRHHGLSVDTIHHKGGHSVPVKDDTALNSMIDWILNVSLMNSE